MLPNMSLPDGAIAWWVSFLCFLFQLSIAPSEMSTARAPSVVATEADRASVAATSAIEIPDLSESGTP